MANDATSKRLRQSAIRNLRKVPWLTAVAALIGVVVLTWLTHRDMARLASSDKLALHVNYATQPGGKQEVMQAFFIKHWKQGLLCMLPAAVLAAIRLRRDMLILPVALVCGWLALYWVGNDLLINLENTYNDPLGMVPSPAAYLAKLALMTAFFMSPPVLLWMYLRSSILDRYVVRGFALPFVLCIAAISGIMITMDLLNDAKEFSDLGFGVGQIGMFYLTQMPRILVVITEAALLLAVLYSLGRMSRYNELISMLSAGRSVVRILLPLLIIGIWCALAVLALNFQLSPEADRIRDDLFKAAKARQQAGSARDGNRDRSATYNIMYRNREDRRTWYFYKIPYNLKDREGSKMNEVYVAEEGTDGKIRRLIMAKHAVWDARNGMWKFTQVRLYHFIDPANPNVRIETPIPVFVEKMEIMNPTWKETPGSVLSDRRDPEFMGVPELRSYLRTNVGVPESSLVKYRVTEHWRYALPFRCFLMVLIAAPLGIVASRRNMLGGVSMAVGIFILIYFLSAVFLTFGKGGYIAPIPSAWLINIIAAVVGIVLFHLRSQNRSFTLNPMRWFK